MNEQERVSVGVIVLLFVIISCVIVVGVGTDKKLKERAEMQDYKLKVNALESVNWTVINMQETKDISKETENRIKADIISLIPSYEPYATNCLMIKSNSSLSIDCNTIIN